MQWLARLTETRAALLATCLVLLAYLPASQTSLVRNLEGDLLDLRFWLAPERQASDAIVLVLIDDASIGEIGRWPWSRAVIADLVSRIEAGGQPRSASTCFLPSPRRRQCRHRFSMRSRRRFVGTEPAMAQAAPTSSHRRPAACSRARRAMRSWRPRSQTPGMSSCRSPSSSAQRRRTRLPRRISPPTPTGSSAPAPAARATHRRRPASCRRSRRSARQRRPSATATSRSSRTEPRASSTRPSSIAATTIPPSRSRSPAGTWACRATARASWSAAACSSASASSRPTPGRGSW
jgi:CHASE2 domain